MSETQESTRRVGIGERLSVSTLLRAYQWMPGIARSMRPRLVAATWSRSETFRKVLGVNGRIILGADVSADRLEAYGLGVLENIQRYLEGLVIASRMPLERLTSRIATIEGLDGFKGLFRSKGDRGIVLLSMHMGEFEPAAALIGDHAPVHVLYHRDPIRTLERIRTRARRRLGVSAHPVDAGLGTWATLRDVLGRGEVVALLGDRVQPGQSGAVVPVFGRSMEIPMGPFKLAASCDAWLVPVFNWRCRDGSLALRMEPPIQIDGDFRTRPEEHPAVRTWVGLMESMIAARPEQWLNVHPVWGMSSADDVSDRRVA